MRPSHLRVGLLFAAALALTSLRLVHLPADMPDTLWSNSLAEYVDEGAKTLTARNLSLFGQTQWHTEDDYLGWMKGSPLTQLLYTSSFRLLGARLETARLATVVVFFLLLLAYAVFAGWRYSLRLGLLGILLLGLVHPLFLFSRSALFEVPLLGLLFVTLFALHRLAQNRPNVALLVMALVCLLATLGIKRTALLYFLPVLLVFAWGWTPGNGSILRRYRIPTLIVSLLLVAGLLARTHGTWTARLSLSWRSLAAAFFANPLMQSAPIVLCLGLLSGALMMLSCKAGRTPRPYLLTLLALALFAPLLLGLFGSPPLRYYVPLIPAYPLLFLECWREQPWNKRTEAPTPTPALGLGLLCLVLATSAFLHFVNRFLAAPFPFETKAHPGFTAPITLRYLFLASVALGLGLWLARRRILQPRVASRLLAGLAAVALLIDGVLGLQFVRSPTFERRDLALAIERTVSPEESVIGDFAPLLTLGSQIPALYMFAPFNKPSRLAELRPDYFLFSETTGMRAARQLIRDDPAVDLDAPVLEGSFRGIEILLYPLSYRELATTSRAGADNG